MNISKSFASFSAQSVSACAAYQTQKSAAAPSASEKLIEDLKKQYQNIHFDFVDFSSKEQIQQYASCKHGNNHVAISPELLQKMTSDESLRAKVEEILDSLSQYQDSASIKAYLSDQKLIGMGLIIDDSGEVSQWTATESLPKESFVFPESPSIHESLFSSTEKTKDFYDIPYKYSQSHHMMRLANAKNIASVRGLIASSHSEIGKVKLKVSDPKEAAAIIRKIKAVIQNGNIKIARLHKEERIYREERLAAKRQKAKLEQQLAEQLRKKRIARKAQEHCQTASFDDIFEKPSIQDERYRQISQQYAADYAALGTMPASPAVSLPPVQVSTVSVTTIDCSI